MNPELCFVFIVFTAFGFMLAPFIRPLLPGKRCRWCLRWRGALSPHGECRQCWALCRQVYVPAHVTKHDAGRVLLEHEAEHIVWLPPKEMARIHARSTNLHMMFRTLENLFECERLSLTYPKRNIE